MGRRGLLPLLPLLFLLFLPSCELTEVTVPPGEDVVVVQAVLSRLQVRQFVVVEYSLTGGVARGPTGPFTPPDEPRRPIGGALVTLEARGPGACAPITLVLDAATPVSGLYQGAFPCELEPGGEVLLRVETPRGEVVTGRTRLPGASAVLVETGRDTAQVPLDLLDFHRQQDTLRIGVQAILARAIQVEVRRQELLDDIAVFLFSDSLGVRLPGNLVNPFEGDSGETVFRAGRQYVLTVAVTDSNYYDFVRSRSDPLTGRGFINHLQGGRGVFGSVEARSYLLRVFADQTDPREGEYRFTGAIGPDSVDLTLEPYLDELEENQFSGFLTGTWPGTTINQTADGFFPGDSILVVFELQRTVDSTLERQGFILQGRRGAVGQPFPVDVFGPGGLLGRVTGRQVRGPGVPPGVASVSRAH